MRIPNIKLELSLHSETHRGTDREVNSKKVYETYTNFPAKEI